MLPPCTRTKTIYHPSFRYPQRKDWRRAPYYRLFLLMSFVAPTVWFRHGRKARCLVSSSPSPAVNLTIATSIRGDEWKGADSIFLENSVHSYMQLAWPQNVILFVDAAEFCTHIPSSFRSVSCFSVAACVNLEFKKPMMPCIFELLARISRTEHILFVNSDNILLPSVLETLQLVWNQPKYAMVGQRRRLQRKDNSISYNELPCVVKQLEVEGTSAIDYFAFRRNETYQFLYKFPPFVIGNWRWDNVLLTILYKEDYFVVDATETADVVHQEVSQRVDHLSRPASTYNDLLARKALQYDFLFGSTANAPFATVSQGGHTYLHARSEVDIVRCVLLQGEYVKLLSHWAVDPDELVWYLSKVKVSALTHTNRDCVERLDRILQMRAKHAHA